MVYPHAYLLPKVAAIDTSAIQAWPVHRQSCSEAHQSSGRLFQVERLHKRQGCPGAGFAHAQDGCEAPGVAWGSSSAGINRRRTMLATPNIPQLTFRSILVDTPLETVGTQTLPPACPVILQWGSVQVCLNGYGQASGPGVQHFMHSLCITPPPWSQTVCCRVRDRHCRAQDTAEPTLQHFC